ncbi:lactate racemase domain-containing protein [Calderihabitans maritimus]|uniref:lactate racemase domain-containing protein n=1 Tax=Calderihabitans maritimus TaxID=1246530 RepID=UPI00192D1AED|nr:lactate racemase domain-containing protein [Calderihabitans maritimus]
MGEGLPSFVKVKQILPRPKVEDIEVEVARELEKINLPEIVKPGHMIAVTAGSRGIANIDRILKSVCQKIKEAGGRPFLVAAMGSHGGGTAEGQRKILSKLGIREENLGVPVLVSDQVVQLGCTSSGFPVYCAREAVEADGLVVVNRVKPHTAFRGENESGLLKMMAVGLGRVPGATVVHRLGPGEMARTIPEIAREMLTRLPVLFGLAIVENGYEETAIIKAIRPEQFQEEEKKLLQEARKLLPQLPVNSLDLLIVKEMGKNFSGTGMDTNVIGRWRVFGIPEPDVPHIRRIVVLDLSPQSHGNATGIGLADFTTRRLVKKINFEATYLNCLTTGFVQRAMLPMVFESDREAIDVAVRSLHMDAGQVRALLIDNTLHLQELYASETLLPELAERADLRVEKEAFPLRFSTTGELIDP